MKKTVLFLFLLFSFSSVGRVSPQEAGIIFNEIGELFKGFELSLEISQKEIPGAFAKWHKRNSSGIITLTQAMLSLPRLGFDEISLIICHEYGHFYGGTPFVKGPKPQGIHTFRNPYENMSVEGQADYFATKECLEKLWSGDRLRMEKAIESVAIIYQEINRDYFQISEEFSFFEPSQARTQETIAEPGIYPSLQCRVDTMLAGLVSMPRPECWFAP